MAEYYLENTKIYMCTNCIGKLVQISQVEEFRLIKLHPKLNVHVSYIFKMKISISTKYWFNLEIVFSIFKV